MRRLPRALGPSVVALALLLGGTRLLPVAKADGLSPGVSFFGGMPAALQGLKYVPIVGSNLSIGDTDLYTVPTGRSALVVNQARLYNPSAGTITWFPELKVGGTYYRLLSGVTLTTGTGGTSGGASAIVLGAGETLAADAATTAGLNLRMQAWEFDASDTRLATSRNLALASGDNTIYTVPAGESAVLLSNSPTGMNAGVVNVVNATGGSLNYFVNVVPSGGTVGSTNQLYPATAAADKTSLQFQAVVTLAAGDFVSVNSSGVDAGRHQIAWVTYYQS